MSLIKKIALIIIYVGTAISLASPLFVDNRFFFPFITTKFFVFRSVVEIMLLAYLCLLALDREKYRPRINIQLILITAFIGVAFISSFMGRDFYLSFWGNMERGEGIILWLHLWVFLAVLTAVVRSEKSWLALLEVSLGSSLLVALFGVGQALNLSFLLNTSGTRVDATFGNASFLAAYLMFQIAFAAYLFSKRTSRWLKGYYLALIVLFTWVIFATQTRGAVIGLVISIIVCLLLLAWVNRSQKRVRYTSLGIVGLVVLLGAGLYFSRQQPFVKNSPLLQRVVSISLQERTAETRLATWQASWEGWRQKFLFGYGMENFSQVFNKNFPTIIYEDEGSQVWFDRAHNLIFDRGVTTGFFGLVLYLAFLLYPAWLLLRQFFKEPEKRISALIFFGLITAFFVQDLFVFETITTYIILFFAMAFLSVLQLPEKEPWKPIWPRALWSTLAIAYLVLLWPVLWQVNIYPAQINIAAAATLRLDPAEQGFLPVVDRYKQILSPNTPGRQEYRQQFVDFVGQQLANAGAIDKMFWPAVEYTDQQVADQLAQSPEEAKNYLLALRHYNYTYAYNPDTKVQRLEKALTFLPKLKELSPTRPQIYQEAGYTNLYLARIYTQGKDTAKANQYFAQAETYFTKAVDLNPKVLASYMNLILLYLNDGQIAKIPVLETQMAQHNLSINSESVLLQLLGMAKSNNRLEAITYFSQELVKIEPNKVDYWIDLALSYAYQGQRQKALETAAKIKSFGGDYISQVDQFIKNVNSGYFEKQNISQ